MRHRSCLNGVSGIWADERFLWRQPGRLIRAGIDDRGRDRGLGVWRLRAPRVRRFVEVDVRRCDDPRYTRDPNVVRAG
eukprot:4019158-Pleurochrysis_carterae.AAC.1